MCKVSPVRECNGRGKEVALGDCGVMYLFPDGAFWQCG